MERLGRAGRLQAWFRFGGKASPQIAFLGTVRTVSARNWQGEMEEAEWYRYFLERVEGGGQPPESLFNPVLTTSRFMRKSDTSLVPPAHLLELSKQTADKRVFSARRGVIRRNSASVIVNCDQARSVRKKMGKRHRFPCSDNASPAQKSRE